MGRPCCTPRRSISLWNSYDCSYRDLLISQNFNIGHYICHISVITSQINGDSTVCSTACFGAQQRKHQSSALLAFVRGIRTQMFSNVEIIFIPYRHYGIYGIFLLTYFPYSQWLKVCLSVNITFVLNICGRRDVCPIWLFKSNSVTVLTQCGIPMHPWDALDKNTELICILCQGTIGVKVLCIYIFVSHKLIL